MRIGIMGAGIAGLSVGYWLRDGKLPLDIYDMDAQPGGLARSFEWHGIHCDLAPHRLFTTDTACLQELTQLVPMRRLRRNSRIHIQGRWIQDPVNAVEMVMKFLPTKSAALVWNYLFRKQHAEDSFEALALNQFGRTLNAMFFKPYSEKLFGIPASEISPAWGRRKIRVGGLWDLIRRKSKLFFKEFYYPQEHGFGAIANAFYQPLKPHVHLHHRLVAIRPDSTDGYVCTFEHRGATKQERFDYIVSSLPITGFCRLLGLDLHLRYRPARLVYLLVKKPRVSENHWFYFADREFSLNRVAEFRRFARSPAPLLEHRAVLRDHRSEGLLRRTGPAGTEPGWPAPSAGGPRSEDPRCGILLSDLPQRLRNGMGQGGGVLGAAPPHSVPGAPGEFYPQGY